MPVWPLVLLFGLPPDLHAPPQYQRLDNNLRVMVVTDHALPLVSVQLWFNVGAAADPPDRPGMCVVVHALLADRGHAGLQLAAAGSVAGGAVEPDACVFHALGPPDLVPVLVAAMAERLRPNDVTGDELDAARGTAARAWSADPPPTRTAASRPVRAALFAGHPYAVPAGFVGAAASEITVENANKYLQQWFVSRNALLVVAGDVEAPAVFELAKARFADIPSAEAPHRAPPVELRSEVVVVPGDPNDAPGLDVAWLTPRLGQFDQIVTQVLMQRLLNPIDGALAAKLNERGAPAPEWSVDAYGQGGITHVALHAAGTELTPNDLRQMLTDALDEIAAGPPTEVQLNRARALATRDVLQTQATFGAGALSLGRFESVAGDAQLARTQTLHVAHVFADDLRSAAAALKSVRTVYAARGPLAPAFTPPDGAVTQTPVLPLPLAPLQPTDLSAGDTLPLLLRHRTAPDLALPSVSATPVATVLSLGNGVDVFVLRMPGMDSAEVRTLAGGVGALELAMIGLVATGSTKRSVAEYRDYLSYHGLDLFPIVDAHPGGLKSLGPPDRVSQMIELQADLLQSPATDDATLAAGVKALDRIWIWQALRPPGATDDPLMADRYLPEGLIGWSPGDWSLPIEPAELRWRVNLLRRMDAVQVIVVGDVAPDAVEQAVRTCWSDWRPSCVSSAWPDDRIPPGAAAASPPQIDEPQTHAAWIEDEAQAPTLWVNDTLESTRLPPPRCTRVWETLGWYFGASADRPAVLDAGRSWRWRFAVVDANWIAFYSRIAPPGFPAAAEDFIARSAALRRGQAPRDQLGLAIRMQQLDSWSRLDGPDGLAEAVGRGYLNPWAAAIGGSEAERVADLAEVYRIALRQISGEGPSADQIALDRFQNPPWPKHGAPATQPDSP